MEIVLRNTTTRKNAAYVITADDCASGAYVVTGWYGKWETYQDKGTTGLKPHEKYRGGDVYEGSSVIRSLLQEKFAKEYRVVAFSEVPKEITWVFKGHTRMVDDIEVAKPKLSETKPYLPRDLPLSETNVSEVVLRSEPGSPNDQVMVIRLFNDSEHGKEYQVWAFHGEWSDYMNHNLSYLHQISICNTHNKKEAQSALEHALEQPMRCGMKIYRYHYVTAPVASLAIFNGWHKDFTKPDPPAPQPIRKTRASYLEF